MSTQSPGDQCPLPERPDLRHLKNQAKDLLKSGSAKTLADAQYQISQLYGFSSWPKLKAHVESLLETGRLKAAIDANDLETVKEMMTLNPALHRAPLGYGKNGPLTWVAECRVPRQAPTPARLAMANWMIDNGSDIHQGGDGPLMRASLYGQRVAMMELLVARGADVNAQWGGHFPIIFAPCETVEPVALQWLLEHGADPNCGHTLRNTPALDYLLSSYVRTAQLPVCIDILLRAGGVTKHNDPAVLALLRGDLDALKQILDADAERVNSRFADLDIGTTGTRMLTLKGATLLHVAAEYGNLEAARLLLESGADVNAPATVNEAGIGGQTAIFHAVTQFNDWGLSVAQLLIDAGANLSLRAKVPGHYERAGDVVECTPLGYAMRFPGGPPNKTVIMLKELGAVE